MTGGTPYLATDTRALAERFQKHPRGPGEVAHPGPRHALRRALPALPAGRAFALLLLETGAAPHPLSADPLTMRFANPHAALAAAGSSRRRCWPTRSPSRRGGGGWRAWATRTLIARMAAASRCRARSLRAALVVAALACWRWRWRGRRRAGARALAQAARARPGGGARLLALDAGQGRLPVAARARQARARAADRSPGGRSRRPGGLRRRDPDLSADHRLRGGEAVLARPRPLRTCRSAAPRSGAPSRAGTRAC